MFSTVDYVLLVLMLLFSLGIGLYYAVFKKQNSAKEYLHGGKKMNFIAVSLSIVSSVISGISLMSVPTEIYYYGSQYLLTAPMMIVVGIVTYFFVLPVFFKLQLTSIYKYLELRFDSKVKLLSSILFTIQMIVYSPVVVYAPGLLVAHVTDINVHIITPVICAVCVVYTVFGGIKAVVWTDALQSLVMLGSIISVIAVGIVSKGGIKSVYNINYNAGRFLIKFDIDPTVRDTFWNLVLGAFAHFMGLFSFSQGTVQKYLSLKDFRDVTRTNIISSLGIALIFLLCILCGFVATYTEYFVAAHYVYCDPKSISKIKKADEILPYYIMDVGKSFPGLAGIFVAGVVSAGLSTLSAILNSLAATMYNDFFKSLLPRKVTEHHEATTLKLIVAILGIICVSLVYVVENLGSLLPLIIKFLGLTNGPMTGLFLVGLLLPTVNSKSALTGGIVSLLVLAWLVFTQWYKMNPYPTLPVYTNSCQAYSNITLKSNITVPTSDDLSPILKISHHIFPVIGIIMVFLVSLVVNCFTKKDKQPVHEDYLSPIVANYIRKKGLSKSPSYTSVKTPKLEINDLQD